MKQEGVKTNFNKLCKLCGNQFIFERKGREESFCKAYGYFMSQYCDLKYAVENIKSINDKRWFPLIALQSAPGG